MKTRWIILFIMALSLFVTVTACGKKEVRESGFLSDYSGMKPGPKGGLDEVYMKPGVDFSKYNKVMMDHVVFYRNPKSEKAIDANELKELSDKFHLAFAKALEGGYPIVTEPGPDVVRIRTAITDLETSKPALSAFTTVMPIGLAVSVVKKAATGEHTGVGSATLEVEFLDSMTNERIAAGIDKDPGSKLSGLTKYGAAEQAFGFWAKRLRTKLDEIHGRTP